MITSPTPWSLFGTRTVQDSQGNHVAAFEDSRDAELVIKRVNEHASDVALLEKELEGLVSTIEETSAKLLRE